MPTQPSRRPHHGLMLAVSALSLLLVLPGCRQESAEPVQEPGAAAPARTDVAESPRVEALRQTLAAHPDDARVHRDLGRLLSEADQHQEAIEHLEQAVQLNPTPNHFFDLAIASQAAMRLHEAQAAFQQVLAATPDDAETLLRLGTLELEMGHKEVAIDYLWQAIQARPDHVMASYQLANIYKFYGDYDEALPLYQSIIPVEPRNGDEQTARAGSLYQIAAIEVARGKNEQAEQLLAQLLRYVPDHPKAHYTRGQALLQMGRDQEAQVEFQRHQEILQQRPVTSGME